MNVVDGIIHLNKDLVDKGAFNVLVEVAGTIVQRFPETVPHWQHYDALSKLLCTTLSAQCHPYITKGVIIMKANACLQPQFRKHLPEGTYAESYSRGEAAILVGLAPFIPAIQCIAFELPEAFRTYLAQVFALERVQPEMQLTTFLGYLERLAKMLEKLEEFFW